MKDKHPDRQTRTQAHRRILSSWWQREDKDYAVTHCVQPNRRSDQNTQIGKQCQAASINNVGPNRAD